MATIKKAQNGAKTKDSTAYYNKEAARSYRQASIDAKFGLRDGAEESMEKAKKATKDSFRQKFKGKPGFDKNGYPLKKAQLGTLIKKGAKAVKSINKLMPSGLKKAQVGTLLRKVAKGTVAGAAAGAAASSTTGCSSGRRHCFHRRSYSTPNRSVPWRKNGGPVAKMKNGGSVKNLSAGPSKKTSIAPKVDPKGAYTKVQERTLGNMKSGGKMKKNKTC